MIGKMMIGKEMVGKNKLVNSMDAIQINIVIWTRGGVNVMMDGMIVMEIG